MSRKYRNPATGEILILEEDFEEPVAETTKKPYPSGRPESETAGNDEPEAEEVDGDGASSDSAGMSRSPFDFLDEIDGKDVEKLALGAALGIGGVLAINGLCSFFRRA